MLQLKYNFPDIYRKFYNGKFTFQKTVSQFSNMALDQVHEQNNTIVKGIGGATHLVNVSDESPLIRWELCAGELSKLLFDFENSALPSKSSVLDDSLQVKRHHEDNESFRNRFMKDVELVTSGFTVNPFEVDSFTTINNTGVEFNEEVQKNITLIPQIGEEQFLAFWNDRLIKAKEPINKTIRENKFVLPGNEHAQKKSKKDPILSQSMISKLRSAYQHRRDDVITLFENEIFGISQSISEDSLSLYHGQKSDILKRVSASAIPKIVKDDSGLIIDLSGIINAKADMICSTFQDFADKLYRHIVSLGKNYARIDIVCDRYFGDSLKEGVRKGRGSGTKINFDGHSKFPAKFADDFLKYSENKEQLNLFLAQRCFKLSEEHSQTFVVTFSETILTNRLELMNQADINHCTA